MEFDLDYEKNLLQLEEEIKTGNYKISPANCFIKNNPVKREIIAADFRDRVVHHLIYNHIEKLFEDIFIHDSYSYRKGKGTLFGIKRLDHFIRSVSENYQKDCYVLKLDIKGYFMNINKDVLWEKLRMDLERKRDQIKGVDFNLLMELIRKTVFNEPTKNCKIKGGRKEWIGLPKDKSLFFAERNCGLPIGNLTSQLFSNVYLNDFDHFVKYKLKCKYYGRYVDDFFIVSRDKNFLKSIICEVDNYLKSFLNLKLHPKKTCLQHFVKGVDFLGAYIKPYRIYIRNRAKKNFKRKITAWNNYYIKKKELNEREIKLFVSVANSYLGIMKHHQTHKLRKKLLTENIEKLLFNYFYIDFKYDKLNLRT
jgi:retron-type reverse transcriptase